MMSFELDDTLLDKVRYLALMGTGLDAAIQVKHLCQIGLSRLDLLERVNMLSGSTCAYFIVRAHRENGLIQENFLDFDKINRRANGCSFSKAFTKSLFVFLKKQSFYPNEKLSQTVNHLFYPEFYNRTLSQFPENICLWSYCLIRKKEIELSVKNGFGDMTVIDAIRAAVSTGFLHNPFSYQDYELIDPIFSPVISSLKRKILSQGKNQLVINYKKNGENRGNYMVKHDDSKNPKFTLAKDFFLFTCNLPNRKIRNTHTDAIHYLEQNQYA